MLILVPGCHHSDRKVPTCYRTWRRRGWCLLELFASFMARDTTNPPLLVRSARGEPSYISSMEIVKLSIGMADFTCCQRNHIITTETQKILSGGNVKKIPCDKPIAGSILKQLIHAKINHWFNAEQDYAMGRLFSCFEAFWCRNTFAEQNESEDSEMFKKRLRWSEKKGDKVWFDRHQIGILSYVAIRNNEEVMRELLKRLPVHIFFSFSLSISLSLSLSLSLSTHTHTHTRISGTGKTKNS